MRSLCMIVILIFIASFLACAESETESGTMNIENAGDMDDSAFEDDGDNDASPQDDKAEDEEPCDVIPLDPVDMPDLDGPSVVSLDEDGFFVVNGVKFFPYGFYGYPADDVDMQEFAAAGFNTTVSFGGCCQGGSLQSHIDRLTFLHSYGVMGAPHCLAPKSQYWTESDADIADWIQQRGNVGSLLFWYTYDEPGIWSIPKDETQFVYDKLKTLDPNHPNALVMAPGEEFTEYMDDTDFMMVDPYPVPLQPMSWVKYTVLEAHAASNYEKPVFGVPQAFDWYHNWGTAPEDHVWRPYAWEMRNMTYQMIVFGVNGMAYFHYNRVHPETERWDGLKEIAAEVVELMPVLLTPDSDIPVIEQPEYDYVDYALKELDGVYYLIIISTWSNDLKVTFDLSDIGLDLCVVDYFSEDQYPVDENGIISMELAGYREAVLQIIPVE